MKKIAIYPGSFDPMHEGHLSVIDKALKLFDKLFVIVSINPDKNNLENIDERYLETKKMLSHYGDRIDVLINKNNLIGQIAKNLNVNFLVRSARNDTDYKYELELAAGNHEVNNELETILIIPDYKLIEYSSTLLRHKKKLGI
ncbi:pantetheine-phosphate adenylyltransferase [Mycoplasmopsis columbina]|uniref:Phosphopantetheine adenylyltransferase n=1 Tax=Mycoplasmopsis columbina SF7 TaxID=1037410 RepID=F9UKH1_9BACT|nr:pantetheine-phosphate adenylyltransferase [Mycoplasmopsis columbina]EGV00176.1 phosphopantetheine adenylyltransferase [Mycoplasmopsis columbina SF7]VEU77070.1 pantetheine-phosphate adenylyltransferase [Mycoplasmopsis columbina]